MAKHFELGKKGEDIAARYLAGKGYHIIDRNWRFGKDEIDIIAEYNNFLVIVVVLNYDYVCNMGNLYILYNNS